MNGKNFLGFAGAILFTIFVGTGLVYGGSATLTWSPNTEEDLNGYRVYYGESSRQYGPFIPVPSDSAQTYTVEGLQEGKTYFFAVTAVDTSGNESGFSKEVVKTIEPPEDTQAPEIQVLQPTEAEFFVAGASVLRIAGIASDDTGVATVTWSTDSGESGQAEGTQAWEIPDLTLNADETHITVAAVDAVGNRGETSLRITYAEPRSGFSVTDLKAGSGKSYSVQTGLENGVTSYTDRNYAYSQVPAPMQGSRYILGANDDKVSKGDDFLRFTLSEDAVVYVAHDDRIPRKPAWMRGFSDTGAMLVSADKPMSIFWKRFSAGEVVLGGNGAPNTNCNMYTVAVREAETAWTPGTPSPEPPPADGFAVTAVRAGSGKSYSVQTGLENGVTSYTDRNYAYSQVPAPMQGSRYILGANDDKVSKGDDFLRFTLSEDAVVYVAHDDRIPRKPAWMRGFSDTGAMLVSADKPMSIFWKRFSAGEVVLGGNGASNTSCNMYTVAIREAETAWTPGMPAPEPPPTDGFTVTDLRAESGKPYNVVDGLEDGETSYIDRNYSYSDVPDTLAGGVYIRTANDDKLSKGDAFLRFSTNQRATVYVAHDDRIPRKPSWMIGFSDTGDDLVSADKPMSLFRKSFPAGEIVLGGNGAPNSNTNNYTVILLAE